MADRIDPFFPALHLPETFGIVPPLGGQRVSSSSLPYRGVNNFLHDNLTGSPGSGVQVGGETVIESVFFFLLFLFLSCSLSSSQERPISRGKRRSFSPSLKKNNPAGVRCSVPGERKGGRNSKRLFLFRREIIYPASSSLSIRPSVYLSISFLALLLGEKQIPRPAGRRENSRRSAHRRWCTHNRGSLSLSERGTRRGFPTSFPTFSSATLPTATSISSFLHLHHAYSRTVAGEQYGLRPRDTVPDNIGVHEQLDPRSDRSDSDPATSSSSSSSSTRCT